MNGGRGLNDTASWALKIVWRSVTGWKWGGLQVDALGGMLSCDASQARRGVIQEAVGLVAAHSKAGGRFRLYWIVECGCFGCAGIKSDRLGHPRREVLQVALFENSIEI